jgi:hypothetical protein
MEAEQIQENWDTFCKFAQSGCGNRSKEIENLLESLGERLAVCPANNKALHGTLVDLNLKVLKACAFIDKKFELELPKESMVICCLFRNLGLIGDLENDLFIEEDRKWQKDQGFTFRFNSDLKFMKPFDRTIWILSQFGIKLSQDEYLAFLSGTNSNENYKFGEGPLAFAIYSATRFIGFKEYEKEEIQ